MVSYELKDSPEEGDEKIVNESRKLVTYRFINGEWRKVNVDGYRYEVWYEYDKAGRLIHKVYVDIYDSSPVQITVYEEWWRYDDKGNETYYKDCFRDFEYWKEYDENGNIVHYKDSDDKEYWYDDKGNKITKVNEVNEK